MRLELDGEEFFIPSKVVVAIIYIVIAISFGGFILLCNLGNVSNSCVYKKEEPTTAIFIRMVVILTVKTANYSLFWPMYVCSILWDVWSYAPMVSHLVPGSSMC